MPTETTEPTREQLTAENWDWARHYTLSLWKGARHDTKTEILSCLGEVFVHQVDAYLDSQTDWPFRQWVRVRLKRRLIDEYRRIYGRHARSRAAREHEELTIDVSDPRAHETVDQVIDLATVEWVRDELALDERELDILARTAIGGETLKSVGADYGVTESRVCQIVSQIRKKAALAGSPELAA